MPKKTKIIEESVNKGGRPREGEFPKLRTSVALSVSALEAVKIVKETLGYGSVSVAIEDLIMERFKALGGK